ncbi:uncharacterized protein [Zea mays]|nr:uncharacterized protein LOC111589940 isoform X2 [Zea mays]|eukprot:XP_023156620.1 uncharacterized protein LOC111589940 isoform X2 [Zea mays]
MDDCFLVARPLCPAATSALPPLEPKRARHHHARCARPTRSRPTPSARTTSSSSRTVPARSQNNQTRMEIPWKRYRASKFQPMMRELDWMFMLQVYYLLHEHG